MEESARTPTTADREAEGFHSCDCLVIGGGGRATGPEAGNTLLALQPAIGAVVAALTNGFGPGDVHGFPLDEVAGAVVRGLREAATAESS